MKHVKHHFDTHPTATEVHETSNGFLFINKGDAEAYVNTLKKEEREITTHTKTDFEAGKKVLEGLKKVLTDATSLTAASPDKPEKPKNKKELEAEAKALAEKEKADKLTETGAGAEDGKTVPLFPVDPTQTIPAAPTTEPAK